MDLNEEKELIEKAKRDSESFAKLYDLHYSRIFGYILKRVANFQIAQDVTSETFLKSLKNIKRFKWQNVPFSAWLYRIASNEIVNFYRKNKKKTIPLENVSQMALVSNPSPDVLEAEDNLKQKQDFLKLHKEISKLPDIYQEVIVLRFFEKKKIKEISEILKKKEGTVKSLLHRGLEKLRVFME